MVSRGAAVAAIVLVSTALGGCGGSDDGGPGESVSSAAAEAPTDLGTATSGDTDLDGEADAGAALTPEQFCGFLTEETPKVIDLQPAEYAAAIFGSDVFDFYSDRGLMTDIDGADMDVLAAEGCPDEASTLLPVLGATSFAELLSM